MYGVQGLTSLQDNGHVGASFAGFFKNIINTTRAANLGSQVTGVRGEVEIDSTSSITVAQARAVDAVIDTDSGTPTITNGYLFKGTYEGTPNVTNKYGLYITGSASNLIDGSITLGTSGSFKSDSVFQFLNTGSGAQYGKFRGIQVSTSYSGTPPSQGILFGTDTNLYRDSSNVLKTDDSLVVAGDLTVNGTTTTVNQTNLDVEDNIIGLNRGLTGANANDSGIIIERGSTGDNAAFLWDESADRFIFGTTTATAASTGDITYTAAPFGGKGLWTTSSAVTHWGVGVNGTAYGTLTWDTGYAKVHATGSMELHLGSGSDTDAVKISGSDVTIAGQVEAKNNAGIYSFSNTVGTSASENIFELENTHGAQAFRATFVCNATGYSVAKTFEVVHMHGLSLIHI